MCASSFTYSCSKSRKADEHLEREKASSDNDSSGSSSSHSRSRCRKGQRVPHHRHPPERPPPQQEHSRASPVARLEITARRKVPPPMGKGGNPVGKGQERGAEQGEQQFRRQAHHLRRDESTGLGRRRAKSEAPAQTVPTAWATFFTWACSIGNRPRPTSRAAFRSCQHHRCTGPVTTAPTPLSLLLRPLPLPQRHRRINLRLSRPMLPLLLPRRRRRRHHQRRP